MIAFIFLFHNTDSSATFLQNCDITSSSCLIQFRRSSGVTPALLGVFRACGQLFIRGTTRSSKAKENKTRRQKSTHGICRVPTVEIAARTSPTHIFCRVPGLCLPRRVTPCCLYGPSGERQHRVGAAAEARRRHLARRPGAAACSAAFPHRS